VKYEAEWCAADFLVNMSASADVLAMAKVEVDLSAIPEGKNVGFTTQIRRAWTLIGTGYC
jgi:hypothetical protein